MIRTKEVSFVCYPVTNVARARSFYEGVLKLRESRDLGSEDSHWIEYDLGPTTLAVSNMYADWWKPSRTGPMVAFEVDDFKKTVAALRKRKTRFYVQPTDNGSCEMAVVADPDGNSIQIHHRKTGS
jgi:catechol 2,3-dioxygenase-like lactoylglutathione lyase family enzyme